MIFGRHFIQFHQATATFPGHFRHRAGQAAGTIVSNTVIELQITGSLDQAIGEFLLGNGIPDLHRRRWTTTSFPERDPPPGQKANHLRSLQ